MITLYTLPDCGICKMIKTKLNAKNIQYNERGLQEIADKLKIDHAPILQIMSQDEDKILFSPSEMVAWINQQE